MEELDIGPRASHMLSERSTTELHARDTIVAKKYIYIF